MYTCCIHYTSTDKWIAKAEYKLQAGCTMIALQGWSVKAIETSGFLIHIGASSWWLIGLGLVEQKSILEVVTIIALSTVGGR